MIPRTNIPKFSVSNDFPGVVNNNGSYMWVGGTFETSTSYIACYYNSVSENVQQIWLNGTMKVGDTTGHKTIIEEDIDNVLFLKVFISF